MPDISIIIPAYNNAGTLDRTLRSVLAQSHDGWEAIIVDDGSRDETAAIAQGFAEADARFRLIRQDNGGAGAARNSGIAAASGEWIIFLDADDVLAPDHLERMLKAAETTPEAGLLHGGWRRFRDGQPWWTPHPARVLASPFAAAARGCPFAIHSAMTRRRHIVEAGAFDPSLRICEDWDLWQRIARTGVVFAAVPGVWADVHVRPQSLSSDSGRHLADGLAVIRRGHAADARVTQPAPAHARGEAPERLADAVWSHAIWTAAAAIGRGGDPLPLIDSVAEPLPAAIDVAMASVILEDGLVVGACLEGEPWPALWAKAGPGIAALLAWLDERSGSGVLGRRIGYHLESRVLAALPADVTATIGSMHQQVIDLADSIPDLVLPNVGRLRCIVRFDGKELGRFDRIIFGAISGQTLASEIRALVDTPDLRRLLAWRRLTQGPLRRWKGRYLSPTALKRLWRAQAQQWRADRWNRGRAAGRPPYEDIVDLLYDAVPGNAFVREADGRMARIIAEVRETVAAQADAERGDGPRTGPAPGEEVDYKQEAYWEGIFASKDPWDYRNNYEALKYDQTIALITAVLADGQRFGDVLEIACAEGEFTRRMAPFSDRIVATDIAPLAVARAAQALKDLPNIACQQLDLLTDEPPGLYDLIVCSEVLYYLEDAETLARFAARVSAHLKPGGRFVTAHANLLVDEPDRTGFGWPHHFGAKGIGAVFAADPALRLTAEFKTPLYRIQRFEKAAGGGAPEIIVGDTAHPLPPRVAEQVRWRGGAEIGAGDGWHDFPILMYHRIAADGPPGLAQWRTDPAAFEAQLAWLRDNGWRGLSIERMAQALFWNHPLPEKTVLLSFDDATRDFLDHALPLLHRYGFPAALFVPTGKVGLTADWDSTHGDPAPLLGWDEIRALKHCDVSIGSHGAMHLPLTALSPETLVRELAGSRAALEAKLDMPVRAIAYPFGDFDPLVRDMARQCGYDIGLTCFDGVIGRDADPLVLRRQEVRGGISLEAFARLLG
ncbi:glycosyltransferase [Novosphingobium sp. UBA1939]|uniref:glycosyltransferase n=1 Tax=Novosphingobium sp. UBA1939 TaxID=1946982 RepID=UPI0025F3FFBD|nr:glycosyltransferase [Novosphingobium sp. UBA1939]